MSKPSGLVLRAGDLARASEGRMVSGRSDVRVDGFSIDSRRVKRGDLFVAIRGARLDGHNFVSEAIQRGAAGVVVGDSTLAGFKIEVLDQPFVIAVENTTRALQLMGREIRRRSGARVVAITGSIGKTTTKELITNVLASAYRVCCSEGNLNNHIGVPLSLLELRHEPEVAVVELGMNHAGEISTLVSLAEPEMRVWTNVAEVHSAFFGSIVTLSRWAEAARAMGLIFQLSPTFLFSFVPKISSSVSFASISPNVKSNFSACKLLLPRWN